MLGVFELATAILLPAALLGAALPRGSGTWPRLPVRGLAAMLALSPLGWAGAAQAQISLVDNSYLTRIATPSANKGSQEFTTGAETGGYTLSSIVLRGGFFSDSNTNTVTLHQTSRTGTKVADFTAAASVDGIRLTLTPTSTVTLAASTTYAVVTASDLGSDALWDVVGSDDQRGLAGWSIADNRVEDADDNGTWASNPASFRITVFGAVAGNNAPTSTGPLSDRATTVNMAFSHNVERATFSDSDGDTLTYSATRPDGSPLPYWLTFTASPVGLNFSGTPTTAGTVRVKLSASDGKGGTASEEFDILVIDPASVSSACPEPSLGTRRLVKSITVGVGSRTVDGRTAHGYSGDGIGGVLDGITSFRIRESASVAFAPYEIYTESAPDAGQLTFSMSAHDLETAERNALRLHVCDDSTGLAFSSATRTTSTSTHPVLGIVITDYHYRWPSAGLDWSAETARKVHLSLPANNDATGDPTITTPGTGVTGDLLTAVISDIADDDGLPDTFEYQWFREDGDGTNREEITGETSSTYTLAAADDGKRIRVRVEFEDLLGGDESRESAAFEMAAAGQVTGVALTPENHGLEVSWDAVTGAAGYIVEWKSGTQSYDAARSWRTANPATTSRDLTGLDGNTEYTVRVTAITTVATDTTPDVLGPPSTERMATPLKPTPTILLSTLEGGLIDSSRMIAGLVVVRIQFHVPVRGLEASEFVVTNGEVQADSMRIVGSGRNVNIWTLVTAPAAGETFTFTIPADVIEGGNHAATYSHTTGTPLTATITTTAPQPVTGNFTAKFTFSETVRIEPGGEDLTAAFNPDPSEGQSSDVVYRNLSFQSYTIRETDSVFNVVVSPRSNYEGTGTLRLKSGEVTALSSPGRINLPAELEVRIDTRLPQLQSMTVDGTSVVLTYHEDLDETSVPGAAAFTVTVDGAAASLAATDPVAVSGPTVTLTLAEAPAGGEVVRVRYTKPSSNPIEDLPGNDAANFDRNLTLPPAMAVTSTPLLRSAGATSEDTYGLGEAIEVTATFAEAVTVTGTPTFTLDVGGTDRTASYVRGTGTTALAFSYTVVAGDSDTDGIAWEANALGLSGGTILGPDSTAEAIVHVAQAALTGHRVDGTRTAGNVPPTASDKTVTTPEDTAYAFTAADFSFADGNPGDTLDSVKITQLESAGDLELDGTDVTLNQVIQKADIDSGKLVFTPAAGASGAGYATFMFRVSDGTAESAADYTMTIDVTAADAIGPRVESIVRHDPAASPTNADSLTWRVTFSEDVANVDVADFTAAGTTATLAVTEATASTVFDVTASGGNLAGLNGTVTLGFAAAQDIADTSTPPNALAGTAPTGADERSWELDNAGPALLSAAVEGTTVTLLYDEPLDAGSVPAAGDYSVSVDGTAAAPSAVALTGSQVALTLGAAPAGDVAVTVSYTVPATNPVRDRLGNEAGALSAQPVTRSLIRLAGGAGDHEGRVEVFRAGQWGTVCDDYWDNRDADVACRMAGHEAGSVEDAGRFRRAHFGEGSLSRIWLDNLRCTGDEESLFDCPRARGIAVGEHNCRPSENVGVRCLVTGGTAPPRVTGIELNAPPGDSWSAGETVEVTLAWSEDVTVATPAGGEPPKLWIGFSDTAHPHGSGVVRHAVYASGSGTARTVFRYTLKAGYRPSDLTGATGDAWRPGLAPDYESVEVYRNSLRLRGGTIVSASGVPAELGHRGHPEAMSQLEGPRVAAAPTISGAGPDGRWTPGETVEVGLPFDRQVLVTTTGGTPSVEIGFLDGRKRRAAYTFGSTTHELIFAYTLTGADEGQTAILVTPDSLAPGGGLIRGWPDLEPAALGHGGSARQAGPAHVAPAGPTASFSGVPDEHDGRSAFTLGFTMSEAPEPGFSFRTVRDHLFEVTGGRITLARRAPPGQDRAWTLTVFPGGTGAITVRMRETRSCDASPRVCTADGRPLAGEVVATVPGPARLSVADAQVREGAGPLEFAVTLSRARTEPSTVRYATADGTATAGEDYAGTSGTLAFEAGVTERTVSVPVLDDAHDEGTETLTLTLSDPAPAGHVRIADGTATGTIANTDPVPRAWTVRFGRTVAEQAVDAVRDRLGADRSPGFRGRLAGRPLPDGTGTAGEAADADAAEDDPLAVPALAEDGRRAFMALLALETGERRDAESGSGPESSAVSADDALLGTSFELVQETGDGLSLGLWGRVARSGFTGRDGDLSLDGEATAAMLGTDWPRRDALFGLMLFRSRGAGGYDAPEGGGRIEAELSGLVPWAGRRKDGTPTFWGAAGTGRGEMTLTPGGGDPVTAGLGWSMAAAGAEGAPVTADALGGAQVGWRADALWTRTASEAAAGLAAGSGTTSRLRLGLEATWTRALASGATLSPRLEAGLRHDGGDAETGFGLETGGGVRFEDSARGLSVALDGRALMLHEDGDFEDWGLAVTVGWDPRPETRLGPSVIATRGWGGASSGGVSALLDPATVPGPGGADGGARLDLEAAWGTDLSGWRHGMVGSAYGRVAGSPDIEDLRLGWRVGPDAGHDAGLDRDFWLEPGLGGSAVIGAGLNRSRERTGTRSSTGVSLAASDGGLEAGFDMAWEW